MEQEQFKKEILPLREKLFLYARRLLDNPEDAEDVMQEVFLKLWYMRGELDYYNNVMALSVQITKHLCLNRMKVRERTEGEADEQFFICDANTPYTQLEQKDSLEHVMRTSTDHSSHETRGWFRGGGNRRVDRKYPRGGTYESFPCP